MARRNAVSSVVSVMPSAVFRSSRLMNAKGIHHPFGIRGGGYELAGMVGCYPCYSGEGQARARRLACGEVASYGFLRLRPVRCSGSLDAPKVSGVITCGSAWIR